MYCARKGLAEALRKRGLNVRSVEEIFGKDPGDDVIKSLATQIGGRVITNNHKDFGSGIEILIDQRATTVDTFVRLIEAFFKKQPR